MDDLRETITQIADLLYQQNIAEAYPRLIQILPQIERYISNVGEVEKEEWMKKLELAVGAMEHQDATLLADILQYEIADNMEM